MKTLGIIPAAGKAERFGNIYKEFLPDKDGVSLLERATKLLDFCDYTIIVTREHKVTSQRHICQEQDYILQRFGAGLHAAIMTGARHIASTYFVVMPDTVFEPSIFDMFGAKLYDQEIDLYLGCFETSMPNRFGVKVGDKWVDKPDIKSGFAYFKAWGFIGFSHRLRDDFASMEIAEFINYCYDTGKNIAEAEMTSYHDMATIEDYKEYLLCG